MSILVSIQSMILWQWPSENEPGQDNAHLLPDLQQRCLDYNKMIRAKTLKYATLDWLTRKDMREGIWKEVIKDYFQFCGRDVVKSARKWEKERSGWTLVSALKGKWLFGKGSVDELEEAVETMRK